MFSYFAGRIITGHLPYLLVVTTYPQFKEGVDAELISRGYEHLIEEIPELTE